MPHVQALLILAILDFNPHIMCTTGASMNHIYDFNRELLTAELELQTASYIPLLSLTTFSKITTLEEKIEFSNIRQHLTGDAFWEYNITVILLLLESGAY